MKTNREAIDQLVDYEGYESDLDMMEAATFDSVSPGICMNDGCDYTTEVEPDCYDGYCECCETNTVKSGLELLLETPPE